MVMFSLEHFLCQIINSINFFSARTLTSQCAQIIESRVHVLTNLCIQNGNVTNEPESNSFLTISSLFRLHNLNGTTPELASTDPLRHLSPRTRKRFNLYSTCTNNSKLNCALYESRSKLSNLTKIANLRDKASGPIDYQFQLEHSLNVRLIDPQFRTHQLENENIRGNRFADNDELRYSLRSLERYPPFY